MPRRNDYLNARERELQWEMGYVIQSGPLRKVGLRVRQSFYRNDFPTGAAFRDENQTRVLVTYNLPIWQERRGPGFRAASWTN